MEDSKTVIIHQKDKSVGLALLLTFFFGPLGMLYTTVVGALVMFVVNVVLWLIPGGFLLNLLAWPVQLIWAASAAKATTTVAKID